VTVGGSLSQQPYYPKAGTRPDCQPTFDPQPTLNPRTDHHQIEKRDYVGNIFFKKIFGSIRPAGFAPIYAKYTPQTECLLHFFKVHQSPLETSSLNRFSRLIRQLTRFCAR